MSGYLRLKNGNGNGAKVLPFPKGGKDGVTTTVEKPKPKPKLRPKRVLSQCEKDLVRIKSLLAAGEETDIDWQYAASFIVDRRDLILDWSVVDALLKSCSAPRSVKKFLVNELSNSLYREFSRCKGKFGKWHHDNARRLLSLVSWIIHDDLRYVNEVEKLRALYSAHNSSFPDDMEHHVEKKLDEIARRRQRGVPSGEPVHSRRKKTSKPKPRLSLKERAKLDATRKERAAARKEKKRAQGKGKGGKGKKGKK